MTPVSHVDNNLIFLFQLFYVKSLRLLLQIHKGCSAIFYEHINWATCFNYMYPRSDSVR